jgi:hypothetical protein
VVILSPEKFITLLEQTYVTASFVKADEKFAMLERALTRLPNEKNFFPYRAKILLLDVFVVRLHREDLSRDYDQRATRNAGEAYKLAQRIGENQSLPKDFEKSTLAAQACVQGGSAYYALAQAVQVNNPGAAEPDFRRALELFSERLRLLNGKEEQQSVFGCRYHAADCAWQIYGAQRQAANRITDPVARQRNLYLVQQANQARLREAKDQLLILQSRDNEIADDTLRTDYRARLAEISQALGQ